MKFDTVIQGGPLYILRDYRLYFPKILLFLSLKIDFVLANSAHLDDSISSRYSLSS